ncbi:hypothetical protein [Streptomyces vietnamensis]|uniref:Uncharacterized protein n=1 Tax=Streptomyces vietnamensis TaxID=362257 RepID=A0A0B5I5N0_9ACTN|nr:hypothetical protein [Streptomyces vietnamensis]AJF67231.1 hypothetical protein SVTN_25480 [Streptomyces vietnamensis]AJF69395.1 hypothetical protein SVTN_39245 [Streptomyces vietnamensis]AJF69400.1 hypothetical protein SVTN_39275 [Streptomyces vietnamensis]
MTVTDTYGTNTHTAQQLADLLTERLPATFAERDSDYFGLYFLATLADTTRIKVQPNTVPGDDGEDDLLEDDHPDVSVLLIVTAPAEAQPLSTELAAVDGLTRLRSSRN